MTIADWPDRRAGNQGHQKPLSYHLASFHGSLSLSKHRFSSSAIVSSVSGTAHANGAMRSGTKRRQGEKPEHQCGREFKEFIDETKAEVEPRRKCKPRLISLPEPEPLLVQFSRRCPSGIRMRPFPGRSPVHTYSGKSQWYVQNRRCQKHKRDLFLQKM